MVRVRIKKFGAARIEDRPGRDLGDIDIQVANPGNRRLITVEAKDLAGARTPKEMANELATTFVTRAGRLSAVDKHLRMVGWLRDHRPEVLAALGLDTQDASTWKVEPLLVVDHELFSHRLTPVAIAVVTYLELEQRIDRANR